MIIENSWSHQSGAGGITQPSIRVLYELLITGVLGESNTHQPSYMCVQVNVQIHMKSVNKYVKRSLFFVSTLFFVCRQWECPLEINIYIEQIFTLLEILIDDDSLCFA